MFFSKNTKIKCKLEAITNNLKADLNKNLDELNQKAKENVLNDRKIYNYLVELVGLKKEKYILPNDFNKIQNIFIDLREDKVKQAKGKMFRINNHITFYILNFDTFYNGLTFKYKNKLIEHYKNIKAELLSKGFINPYFTSASLNINGTANITGTLGIDSATNIDNTISINNADLIEAGLIPSGKSSDGYNMYTYKDPDTDVLVTVTIDFNGHILNKQIYTPSYNLAKNLYEDLYKYLYKKYKRRYE